MRLPAGKVPPWILERTVFRHLGAVRGEVAVGPSMGVDSAVIGIGDRSLAVSMDPITGALERIGWLAVNINANDVAVMGVRPEYYSSCLLLPENAPRSAVAEICRQIDSAAAGLGVAVVGGHTETTPGLSFPIVIGCCMGSAPRGRFVTSRGARAGDDLIMTKYAGMEGSAILASDRRKRLAGKLGKSVLGEAEGFYRRISVVDDALIAFGTGGVTAMHDPTEGGVANGVHELAEASGKGFRIFEDKIPVAAGTAAICKHFGIDPLQLIASGSLLISSDSGRTGAIVTALRRKRIPASVIGKVLPSTRRRTIVRTGGREEALARPGSDHLWAALGA